jgi:GT2 family glycosyltransferase
VNDRPERSNGTEERASTSAHLAPASVTAIVLTHKRPRLATAAVRSLVQQEGFPPDRVVVVVNGAGGLQDEALEARVHMVRLPRNLGPAGGFAAGMEAAFSDPSVRWAYLCEDDVGLFSLPSPRVADVVDRAEERNRQPARPVGAVVAYGRRFVGRGSHTVNLVPSEGSPHELVPVDVAMWGATLLAREVFDAGIRPDDVWFFGLEDFDFFCRVREQGFDVFVDAVSARAVAQQQTSAGRAEALAPHRPTYESEAWRWYYDARNRVLFTKRHGRPSWHLWDLAFAARRVQKATGRDERRAMFHGLWDGARGRFGEHPNYGRTMSEHAVADETNEKPDPACAG